MGYVDKLDMLKSLYEVDRKYKKWCIVFFFYFIHLSLVDFYVLFNKTTDSKAQFTLKQFRLSVALGFLGSAAITAKKRRPFPIFLNAEYTQYSM